MREVIQWVEPVRGADNAIDSNMHAPLAKSLCGLVSADAKRVRGPGPHEALLEAAVATSVVDRLADATVDVRVSDRRGY